MAESQEISPQQSPSGPQRPGPQFYDRFDRKKILKDAGIIFGVFAGLFFLYSLFNWTMSAMIHSRKEVMVPDLQSKSLAEALTLVSNLNLGLKKESEELNNAVPGGTIIRQNPLPGMIVREGKIIRIIVSQGGEVIFVPNLVGQPVRSAEIAIRSGGLNLGEESTRYSIVMEKGKIVEQDPKAGSITEKDALVNMVVSAGVPPEGTILVPDFSGKAVSFVRDWSRSNKIDLEVSTALNSQAAKDSVVSQDPPPDSDITESQTLKVTIASESAGKPSSAKNFYYEIPQGGESRQLKITMIDDDGEREIFRGTKPPGSKLEIPVEPKGSARIRIFINGILVEEKSPE